MSERKQRYVLGNFLLQRGWNVMAKTFLTYEQLDALIVSGVRVTLAESGRVLVVWSSAHHGSMYAWNGLAQSFQFVRGAYRS